MGVIPIVLFNRVIGDESTALTQGAYYLSTQSWRFECAREASFEKLRGLVDMADIDDPDAVMILCRDLRARRQYINNYELGLLEIGQVLQNLALTAVASGVHTCALGAVSKEPILFVGPDDPKTAKPAERWSATPAVGLAVGYPTKP